MFKKLKLFDNYIIKQVISDLRGFCFVTLIILNCTDKTLRIKFLRTHAERIFLTHSVALFLQLC